MHSIFQPNNHSTWQIGYRPVSAETYQAVEQVFLMHFKSLGEHIISLEQVDEAEINSNNFKVITEKGPFLLRRYPKERDVRVIEETYTVLSFLRDRCLSVPEVLAADTGQKVVDTGDAMWSLFTFLAGNHFRGTLLEVRSLGAVLGKVHAALREVPGRAMLEQKLVLSASASELRTYSQEIWQDIFARARNAQSESHGDDFHGQLLAARELIERAVDVTESLRRVTVPRQLVHFDAHPHNVLADGEQVLALIDFDSLKFLERIRAVAFSLHRSVRQHVVFTEPLDRAAAIAKSQQAFLDSYSEHDPLTNVERSLAGAFVQDEALSRLSYAMKDYYFNNNPAWKGDLEKQTAVLAEAAYLA